MFRQDKKGVCARIIKNFKEAAVLGLAWMENYDTWDGNSWKRAGNCTQILGRQSSWEALHNYMWTWINPYSWTTIFSPLLWNILRWKTRKTRLSEDLICIAPWESQRMISPVVESHITITINVFLNVNCLSNMFSGVATVPLTKTKRQRLCSLHSEWRELVW